jgi:hypothetical protein
MDPRKWNNNVAKGSIANEDPICTNLHFHLQFERCMGGIGGRHSRTCKFPPRPSAGAPRGNCSYSKIARDGNSYADWPI